MGLLVVVIIIAIFLRIARATRRSLDDIWEQAADRLGVAHQGGGWFERPHLTGTIGQTHVSVGIIRRGKNSHYTHYAVRFPARTEPFQLSRQHLLSGITKAFGSQDVEMGDARFDKAFMVKAHNPRLLASYMTPSRRVALTGLAATFPSTTVTEGHIELTRSGVERSADRIVSVVRRMVAVAARLHEDEAAHSVQDRALRSREAGDLAAATRALDGDDRAHPDDIEGRILDIDSLATAERTAEAAHRIDALEEALPADPQVIGWKREVAAAGEAAPAPRRDPGGDTPADELIKSLFGTTKLSFETAEAFRLEYRNRQVEWQGTVRSARPFRSDYDFGQDPGVKAVITIAEVAHDLYGNSRVDAVVELPPGTELDRDDVVAFAGRLLKVDALMRNIYVADAELLDD